MNFDILKNVLPKGIYGRSALILLLPVVTIQFVVSVVFIQRLFEDVTQQMVSNVALEINHVVRRINAVDGRAQALAEIAELAGELQLTVDLMDTQNTLRPDVRNFYDLSGKSVIATFRDRIKDTLFVDLKSSSHRVTLQVSTNKGTLSVIIARTRVSATNPHQLLVLMVFTSILMALISIIFLRNQLRPIRRLSRAAEAFGKGQIIPYNIAGATEVRSAGQAFIDMRDRIERQIEQRTLMLSGVSHDLRTPLTRLKLGLSMAEQDAETTALLRDVNDMELTLDEFLTFARGDSLEEPTATDVVVLLEKQFNDARSANIDITLNINAKARQMRKVTLRPVAIGRALMNLIANSGRYGSKCRLSLVTARDQFDIVVEDNGPGIARAQRDDAIRPFIRLDQARNQDSGAGVGLGLSIAKDIARSHGGALILADSDDLGGLKAILRLPV